MPSQSDDLLARLRRGVVDPDTPLSSLLNTCLVLGGQAKSEKLREWARHELRGYPDGEPKDYPEYRRVHALLSLRVTNHAGRNGHVEVLRESQLPEQFTKRYDTEEMIFHHGVAELEAMVRSDKEIHHFSPGWGPVLCDVLNKFYVKDEFTLAHSAYFEMRPFVIEGVLGRIRSALADLVAELDVQMSDDQTVPDKAMTDRAVTYIFTGERPTVHHVSQHANDGGTNTAALAGSDGGAATISTGGGTTIGSQNADGGATVVGSQQVGDHGVVAGRDFTGTSKEDDSQDGFWARLRKRGAIVAAAQIIGAIAGVAGVVVAVWIAAGWPAPWN